MQQHTLIFLLRRERQEILLAMKKRGFGAGKYNGIGGKVHEGEDVPTAAVREANEEIGVTIDSRDLAEVARISFSFDRKPSWDIVCFVFCTEIWHGEPAESEEMEPHWFSYSDIPYDRMWVDDRHWLPRVLAGKRLTAAFHFNADGSAILRQSIDTI